MSVVKCRGFHVTSVRQDLLDFFDDPKNWGEQEVKTDYMYVLLKEKNMLLTMEAEYKRSSETMLSPERIYKVEESMKNLEIVVRERNRAYNLLETGHDGERPTQLVENVLGLHKFYRLKEHFIPFYMNRKWLDKYKFNHWDLSHVAQFKKRFREKMVLEKNKERSLCKRYVKQILKKYPNVTDDAILSKYPDVNIKRLREEMD
uniref:Large ribosomal subunit protein uL29m n=1 Tax=Strigamia maritima TaxID=126957 RepID=T1IZD1_STRMM